jgi:AcrR family transcriptional regulator
MAKQIDRRVARTQTALREALIRLLRRKDYAHITVQDILDEADVGRSTFYAHCAGKDQLVRLSFRLLRSELAAGGSSADAGPAVLLPFSLPLIRHLAEHRDLYGAFAGSRAGDLLMSELRHLVLDLAGRGLKRLPADPDMSADVVLHYVAGAFTALLAWWLNGKGRLAPEALDAMFQRLACDGLMSRDTDRSAKPPRPQALG